MRGNGGLALIAAVAVGALGAGAVLGACGGSSSGGGTTAAGRSTGAAGTGGTAGAGGSTGAGGPGGTTGAGGSTGPGGTTGAGGSTGAGGPPGVTPSPRQPFRPPVGAALRVRARGTTLVVTVTRVLDPLRRAGVSLLPGSRAVGVLVRIRNRGPGEYDSSSTGDVSIVPASGAAAAAFAARGRCMTEDRDFDNAIGAGETRVGCVVFSLDAGARLAAVRFSANAGGSGVATWQPPAR